MKDRLITSIAVSTYEEISIKTGIRAGKPAVIIETMRVQGKRKHSTVKFKRHLLPQVIEALKQI